MTKPKLKDTAFYYINENDIFRVDLPHIFVEKDLGSGLALKIPDSVAALYTGIILGQWLSALDKTIIGATEADKMIREYKHKMYMSFPATDIPEDEEEWMRLLRVELANCGLEHVDEPIKIRRR